MGKKLKFDVRPDDYEPVEHVLAKIQRLIDSKKAAEKNAAKATANADKANAIASEATVEAAGFAEHVEKLQAKNKALTEQLRAAVAAKTALERLFEAKKSEASDLVKTKCSLVAARMSTKRVLDDFDREVKEISG